MCRLLLTVVVLEDVEDGEDLSVVRHQSFSHQLGRHHQVLQDLQGAADHLPLPGVQGVCKRQREEAWSKGEAASVATPPTTGLISAGGDILQAAS